MKVEFFSNPGKNFKNVRLFFQNERLYPDLEKMKQEVFSNLPLQEPLQPTKPVTNMSNTVPLVNQQTNPFADFSNSLFIKDYNNLINATQNFISKTPNKKFPAENVLISKWVEMNALISDINDDKLDIVQMANNVEIIVDKNIETEMIRFIEMIRGDSTHHLNKVYLQQNINSAQAFVKRCITKRPIVFFGNNDTTYMRDGAILQNANVLYRLPYEAMPNPSLALAAAVAGLTNEYITLEEINFSQFISVAVPTYFINDGTRENKGRVGGYQEQFIRKGIMYALVGPRLNEEKYYTDNRYLLKEAIELQKPSDIFPVYKSDDIWVPFYNVQESDFASINGGPTSPISRLGIIKRYEALWIPLLNYCKKVSANNNDTKVVLRTVIPGSGAWASPSYVNLLKNLALDALTGCIAQNNDLSCIKVIELNHYAWPKSESGDGSANFEVNPKDKMGNIIPLVKIDVDGFASHTPNVTDFDIFITTYSWDGNSYPGNEFWLGALSASDDPAAASCSFISQLQNPDINPSMLNKISFL